MEFDKFLIYLRFICKACRLTRTSMRKFTGERVKEAKEAIDFLSSIGGVSGEPVQKLEDESASSSDGE